MRHEQREKAKQGKADRKREKAARKDMLNEEKLSYLLKQFAVNEAKHMEAKKDKLVRKADRNAIRAERNAIKAERNAIRAAKKAKLEKDQRLNDRLTKKRPAVLELSESDLSKVAIFHAVKGREFNHSSSESSEVDEFDSETGEILNKSDEKSKLSNEKSLEEHSGEFQAELEEFSAMKTGGQEPSLEVFEKLGLHDLSDSSNVTSSSEEEEEEEEEQEVKEQEQDREHSLSAKDSKSGSLGSDSFSSNSDYDSSYYSDESGSWSDSYSDQSWSDRSDEDDYYSGSSGKDED
jgi:hypothetical protein